MSLLLRLGFVNFFIVRGTASVGKIDFSSLLTDSAPGYTSLLPASLLLSLCSLALFQHVMDSALHRLGATPIVIGNSYSLSKHGRMPSIEKPIEHVSYRY